MKAARAFVFVAICMFAGQADASCFGWGSPGYGALASDCGFADSLWAGYCSGGPAVCASDCCAPCNAGFGWYGANAGGCDTGCGGGCGSGSGGGGQWMARLKSQFQNRAASQACGSCCSPGGSWCDSGCGGCSGGSGMLGSWRSMGTSSGCGCESACDDCCGGGGRQSNWKNLRARLMGGCCQRRYQPPYGAECMCENVRGFGSFRSWIGGGPLDSCGLVSYDSLPAHGIDYSYLDYCGGGAATTAPVGQPTLATPPANETIESGSTTTMSDEMSDSIYDESHSFKPENDFDANRSSELIPRGSEANGE